MVSEIDNISFASYLLKPCIIDKNNPSNLIFLSDATGFIYKRNGKQYLITNLHVVSGRNPCTGKILDIHKAIPELLRLFPSLYEQKTGRIEKISLHLDCWLYDQNNIPLWLIHPNYKRGIDIAILPMDKLNPPINFFAI